jgi:hypothetical protein
MQTCLSVFWYPASGRCLIPRSMRPGVTTGRHTDRVPGCAGDELFGGGDGDLARGSGRWSLEGVGEGVVVGAAKRELERRPEGIHRNV